MMGYKKTVKGSHQPILDFISEIGKYTIKAGILENNKLTLRNKTPIAEYAFYNEFGTKNIPERPFIGTSTDEDSKNWIKGLNKDSKKTMAGVMSIDDTLTNLGKRMKKSIKTKIKTITTPENAPSTIKKKGFDNPLIDTGLMLDTVDYEVIKQ